MQILLREWIRLGGFINLRIISFILGGKMACSVYNISWTTGWNSMILVSKQVGGMQLIQEHMILSVESHLSANHHHHLQLVPSVLTVFDPNYVGTTLFLAFSRKFMALGISLHGLGKKAITFIVWKLLQWMIRVNWNEQ